MNIGFSETHRNFLPSEPPDDERYLAPLPWLPDTPEIRRDVAELNTSVRHVDAAVSVILNALAKARLVENTLVVFTTDHGVPFPGAKATLYDRGIGVSLIVRGPHGFTGGGVVEGLVSQIDLIPTLLPLMNVDVPAHAQGVDLMPLVRGAENNARNEIFAEMTHHGAYDPVRCIRTKQHKYIYSFEERPRMFLANIDNSPSKSVLAGSSLPREKRLREELFDLTADPLEFENLAEKSDHGEVMENLKKRLFDWMEATNDPILKGPVPPAEGMVHTPPTA